MNVVGWLVIALAPFAPAGCTADVSRPAVTPAATVVGEPQSCVSIAQLRETRIRDDWTIDFIGNGCVWRNTLTSRCASLKSNDAITYDTSLNQLCKADRVDVLERAGDVRRGPTCWLGPFVPVQLKK